jgi:hypothetical protein
MATKYSLKCGSDGAHEVYGPDGKLGEIEDTELRQYAEKHLGKGRLGAVLLPAVRLSSLVQMIAGGERVDEQARNAVLSSPEGRQLWEQQRLDDLATNRVVRHFTQDKR